MGLGQAGPGGVLWADSTNYPGRFHLTSPVCRPCLASVASLALASALAAAQGLPSLASEDLVPLVPGPSLLPSALSCLLEPLARGLCLSLQTSLITRWRHGKRLPLLQVPWRRASCPRVQWSCSLVACPGTG